MEFKLGDQVRITQLGTTFHGKTATIEKIDLEMPFPIYAKVEGTQQRAILTFDEVEPLTAHQ
jgi:hypothetical protein